MLGKRLLLVFCLLAWVLPGVSHAISQKSYSYDKYGNLEEIIDSRGFATQYQYDLLNRLEKICYPDNKKVAYVYDLMGVRIRMEDARGATLFEPDEFGQINKVTFPDGQAVTYQYDTEGNRTKLIYPDGVEIEYIYDFSNRLEAIRDLSGITKFEYDESSNLLQKKTLSNGITTEYQYHTTRKISKVIHKQADGKLIEEFWYGYDANGNRTKIEKTSPNGKSHVVYIYDKLNRVTRAEYSDGFFESFVYDGAGNRLRKTTPEEEIIYEYDEENRLKKAGDTTYVYDLAGNLAKKISLGRRSIYKYDYDNRLIFYSDASNQVTFEYDGDGNRVSKTVNGVRTDYINDLVAPVSQVLLKKVSGNGKRTTRYVYGGSRISQSSNGNTQFYLHDSMGRNVSALVSFSGKVLNSYEYDAFGNILSAEQSAPDAYKYCGEEFDEETGLIFLRNRYYDPEIGRFISKDSSPGKLLRPSTLNPYCYVENNPVNFIDPWGLEAIEPETAEMVVVHINALPGALGGQGLAGHAFMQFPARQDGDTPYLGSYPEGPNSDEASHINSKTISIACYCNSKKVTEAIEVMKQAEWTCSNNCVRTVKEGMEIMGFYNAERVQLAPIPLPIQLKAQMLRLYEPDPARPLGSFQEAKPSRSTASSPTSFFKFGKLDFGGVSLSRAAEIQLSLTDIAGVTFDPVTGQLILFGPQNRYLPPIDLDDLAVAVRSLYGIGIAYPESPGLSIDPCPIPGQCQVKYMGTTAGTSFGQIMFEADRLMKCLKIGKDNITGQPISASVPGYNNSLNRALSNGFQDFQGSQGNANIHSWFEPDHVVVVETEDHQGMIFSDARIKLLTEAQFNGSVVETSFNRAFVDHFNAHFDEFAKEFPVFEKLKTLGKITAVVKWIRDNEIPFDISFFYNYQPKKVETVQYTPTISSQVELLNAHKERRRVKGYKHKQEILTTAKNVLTCTGGVTYRLDKQNFTVYTDPAANVVTGSALESRPSEQDFIWSFQSPTNRETFVAVAQSIHRIRKPGNVKKRYIDASFSVPGNQQLSLERFYNSFQEKETTLGRGWRIIPYELELSLEKVIARSQGGITCETSAAVLLRTPEGEYLYKPVAFSTDGHFVFKSPDCSYFLEDNLNGTFSLLMPKSARIDFDQDGRLIKIVDANGLFIEYYYSNHNLVCIYHQNGAIIALEYEGDRLVEAVGPDNVFVRYNYHSDGQLGSVINGSGDCTSYSYDVDKRLSKVTNSVGDILFEASYDDYNRAILVKEGSRTYEADFSLEQRTMKVLDDQGREAVLQFDDQDRLIYKQGFGGLEWIFSYEQENIKLPNKIIDPKGGVTECYYDASRNPIYFKNAIGAEWRFFYGEDGSLTAQTNPNGRAVINMYGKKGKLLQTFLKVSIEIDENDRLASTFGGFQAEGRYTLFFDYDMAKGQLVSRKNSRHVQTSFAYHANGALKEICSPTGYKVEQKVDEKGNLIEISDEFGLHWGCDYDKNNRVAAIRTAAGITHFTYDDRGVLRLIVDPKGNRISYNYDSQNNLSEVLDEEGKKSSYEYNSFHQLTHLSLPNGSCKTIEYDAFGRLSREIWGR